METRKSRSSSRKTRTSRNSYLYDSVENLSANEKVIDFNTQTKIDLSILDGPPKTRVEARSLSDGSSSFSAEADKEEVKDKIYDINKVLEEARKAKPEDEKNKYKADEYSLLDDLNKKYISQREKQNKELEQAGIEEVINSITSVDLKENFAEILSYDTNEKELMGDLIATDAALNSQLEDGILKERIADTEDFNDSGHIVNSFYTRSMDLSEDDFELKDVLDQEMKTNRKIIVLVVAIVIVILIMISLFILTKLNII